MAKYLRAYYDPPWRFASRQFLYACLLDLQALKPGNVGLHGEGHGKTCQDFRRSAQAAAELITRPDWSLGRQIREAARASWGVAGCNTNLGVLLLTAPLVSAYYREDPTSLEQRVEAVLAETTANDARDVYRAIQLMQPAGLGRSPQADIRERPKIALREAMALAAERDHIAAQYRDGFPIVFTEARPQWESLCLQWGDARWAMVGVFLTLLGRYPDSHIARVHGEEAAKSVSGKIKKLADEFCGADAPDILRPKLLELDASWKSAGLSPGTTADLTLAGVLAARLDGWSDDRDTDVLSQGDDSRNPSGASA